MMTLLGLYDRTARKALAATFENIIAGLMTNCKTLVLFPTTDPVHGVFI
jgi:hypothetical protein